MNHYKSWSGLEKQLSNNLCLPLRRRVSYFLTRYHDVHNAYGRAAIRYDGKELVTFSWIEQYHQENDLARLAMQAPDLPFEELENLMKPSWDALCTYHEQDFLAAALEYRSMNMQQALASDNYIIRILAVLDKRVGRRALAQIAASKEYEHYPAWVRQFYELRLSLEE